MSNADQPGPATVPTFPTAVKPHEAPKTELKAALPPVAKGPVIDPPAAARHPYYVAHTTFHLPNGDRFNRGDVLFGKDALGFETALNDGVTDINFATPTPHDFDPRS